jgi:dTDP-4-dehydrorhamnose reductase
MESLLAGKQVKAFSDQVVSPTLADNAAEMVIGVHRSGEQGLFHTAGATAVSRVEFCLALARKLGASPDLIVPTRLAELKLPAPRPLRCALRVEKVQKLLGAQVPLPLDAALDRFLAERRAGGAGLAGVASREAPQGGASNEGAGFAGHGPQPKGGGIG